ncbi:MAG: N-acetylmuramoyl-L-alanine amidase [Clostridium sp.]|uniref:N-acetylmuramoyl-L-alanine amidase family protein n=1 Tax=Clostridium sp. TaxID=1506 RepID=UPI003D6CF624
MSKKKKGLLVLMCIFVIGGALYSTNYAIKKHEKSVQAIKIKQEADAKVKEEGMAKAKEDARAKARDEADALAKKEADAKVQAKAKAEAVAKAKKEADAKGVLVAKAFAEKKALEEKKASSSQKVIVIDPGHASVTSSVKEQQAPGSNIMKVKEPGGTQGINTKTPEYVVNMAVALKLRDLLQEKGYIVKMTKTQISQMLGNIARAEVGNNANADLVIRIHADGNNNSSVNGASMLVPSNTKNTSAIYSASKKYGQKVLSSLINTACMKNRGVNERSDITGFNWSKVPVILVEMGFQSNPTEDKLLISGAYQDKIAKGLAEGIDQAMK